jgi:hypothetical protein
MPFNLTSLFSKNPLEGGEMRWGGGGKSRMFLRTYILLLEYRAFGFRVLGLVKSTYILKESVYI